MKRRRNILLTLVMMAFLSSPVLVQAQFGDPDPEPPEPPTTAVPFDAGLSVIIGAGIAYAAKKQHDKKKAENK